MNRSIEEENESLIISARQNLRKIKSKGSGTIADNDLSHVLITLDMWLNSINVVLKHEIEK